MKAQQVMPEPTITPPPEAARPYADGMELLADLLAHLDTRLALLVEAMGEEVERCEDPALPGLVITAGEARRALAGPPPLAPGGAGDNGDDPGFAAPATPALSPWQAVEARVEASRQSGLELPLDRLRERFALSPFELDCLLACLAPEVDRRYAKVFAYLNDDVTRKGATADLLLRLFASTGEEKLRRRSLLAAQAPLLRHRLLALAAEGERSGDGVTRGAGTLRIEEGVLHFLLGEPLLAPELEEVLAPPEATAEGVELWRLAGVEEALAPLLDRLLAGDGGTSGPLVCRLTGRPGSGRRYAAETACAARGLPLIPLDGRRLAIHPAPASVLARAFRDSLLRTMPLLLHHAGALVGEARGEGEMRWLLEQLLDEMGWLLFICVDEPGQLADWFPRHRVVEIEPCGDGAVRRRRQWQFLLAARAALPAEPADRLAEELAAKFRLTPGQIGEVFHRAGHAIEGGARAEAGAATPGEPGGSLAGREEAGWSAELHRAARRVAAPRLGHLAQKIEPLYHLADIVLPEPKLDLLLDVVRQVRHRRTVMEEWGFGATLARGKGVSALFFGPPGTGKTMAAEVIANELAMDLYRIDLASVVSKYVGETEKNLARIFDEAEHSDAILFFDEADALFGKRSEVKDAHDRYANIEINYLLQRMESYQGVAILATNLRQNLDEAFLRRLRIVLELPVPGEEDRLRIWKKAVPRAELLAAGADLPFLARQFELTGGHIKNAALAAAFLAAEEGGPIQMGHLVRGLARELEKLGRRSVKEKFGPYHPLLGGEPPTQP